MTDSTQRFIETKRKYTRTAVAMLLSPALTSTAVLASLFGESMYSTGDFNYCITYCD